VTPLTRQTIWFVVGVALFIVFAVLLTMHVEP